VDHVWSRGPLWNNRDMKAWNFWFFFFIFLIASGQTYSAITKVTYRLACGTYLAHGVLITGEAGDSRLVVNAGTGLSREFVLIGGNVRELIARSGLPSSVRFYVPQPLEGNSDPTVFFQEFVCEKRESSDDSFRLLKSERCGDKNKYHIVR
jgi:hypothetical protein